MNSNRSSISREIEIVKQKLTESQKRIAQVEAEAAAVTKVWVTRTKRIGCPCDSTAGFKCTYATPHKARNWPCSCICHNVQSFPEVPYSNDRWRFGRTVNEAIINAVRSRRDAEK